MTAGADLYLADFFGEDRLLMAVERGIFWQTRDREAVATPEEQ